MARIGEQVIWVGCQNQGANSYKYGIDIYEDSTNIVSNNGYYRIVFSIMPVKSNYAAWTDSDATFRITTNNGQSINADSLVRGSTSAYPNYNQWYTIATWRGTLNHKDDGSLDISVSINFGWNNGAYAPNNATISLTSPATVIPRASDITNQATIVMGSTGNEITVTQKSTSFSHILYYGIRYNNQEPTTWVEIGRDVADKTYTWTAPDISDELTTSSNIGAQFRALTYLASDYSGDPLVSDSTFILQVPSTYIPTISIDNISEINPAVPSNFPFIVGYSKVRVTTTAAGVHGSTITSRAIQIGSEIITNTSSTATVDVDFTQVLKATTNQVYASVIDSRGRTGSSNTTINAIAYSKPQIEVSYSRCNADGSVNAVGTYIKVLARWNVTPVNNLNSSVIKVLLDSTQKATYTPTVYEQTTWTQIALVSGVAINNQYTLTLRLEDLLDVGTAATTVSKAAMAISAYDESDGIGVSFGRMATEPGWNFYDNDLTIDDGNEIISNGHMYSEKGYKFPDRQSISSLNLDKTADEYGVKRLDLSTSNITSGKPMDDGYVETYFWDNSSTYDTQVYYPNKADDYVQIRTRDNQANWGDWRILNANIYSLTEIKTTNTWIDGKPIYRNTIQVSSLPNATATNFNHNISNVSSIWVDMTATFIIFSDGSTSPFNYIGGNNSNLNASIELRGVTTTKFTIDTHTTNRSSASAYITLHYTKTTD